jgi:hypothetical protein
MTEIIYRMIVSYEINEGTKVLHRSKIIQLNILPITNVLSTC